MALNFPASPALNDIYEANGTRWQWDGSSWVRIVSAGNQGFQGVQGATGAQGVQGANGVAPWSQDAVGLSTITQLGVNTTGLAANTNLVGIGNSLQGVYVSNGMYIFDNHLEGNHYIGTAFNGLMAGPVTVNGTLTVDGVWVVV